MTQKLLYNQAQMTMQTIIKRNMKIFLFVNPPRKKNASTNANTNADARQMTTHASQKEPNNYSDSSIPQDTHNLKSYTNADAEKNESENVVQSNIIDNEDAVRKEPVDSL